MPMLSQRLLDDFRRELSQQRKGAEDSAMPLSRVGAAVLGAVTRHIRPSLAADSQVSFERALRGVTRENFRKARPFIARDIRKLCEGKLVAGATALDRLPELLDALEIDAVMGLDSGLNDIAGNEGQRWRQANYQSRPTAHDEPLPSESGTSSMHTMTGIPTELQIDSAEGSNNEEGMRVGGLSPGNTGATLRNPPGVGLHNAAHDAYKAAFDYVYGELAGGMLDAGRCAALRAVLKSQGFTDADCEMILRQNILAPMEANNMRGTGASDNDLGPVVEDEPPDLPGGGRPTPEASQTPLKADRCVVGDHIGQVLGSYSPDALSADPGQRARRQYSLDITEAARAGLDSKRAHAAAVTLAQDRENKRDDSPSPVFFASGAHRIEVA